MGGHAGLVSAARLSHFCACSKITWSTARLLSDYRNQDPPLAIDVMVAVRDRRREALADGVAALGTVDLVIVAHGSLPEQADCEQDDALVAACMDDNFTSAAVIMHAAARCLAEQGRGTLAVISSVAGDRGRKSNYTYGAAKAGLDAVAQGLQGRFSGTAVRVVNIKPGMVASPMTAHMDQGPLFATPEGIAPRIQRAVCRRGAAARCRGQKGRDTSAAAAAAGVRRASRGHARFREDDI